MSTTEAPARSGWTLAARPKGKNEEGKNSGAMVIFLKHATYGEEEIGRVAFERKEGHYTDETYDVVLDRHLDAAQKSIELLDKLTENRGRLL